MELLYWEPSETAARRLRLADAAEFAALADDLLTRYVAVGSEVPGVELRTTDEGESLSVAVAAFGWALIHTDENVDQHCTVDPSVDGDESVDVRWEEPTLIPRRWFVGRDAALAAVRTWFAEGALAPELDWSDRCF